MHVPVITGLYAGLLGILLVVLIVRVGWTRKRVRVALMDGGNPELMVAIRQHGNFIEMVPMCLILIGILELQGVSIYVIHALGIVLLVCRLIHPFGLDFQKGETWQRAVGAGGSTLVLLVAACWAIYRWILSSGF